LRRGSQPTGSSTAPVELQLKYEARLLNNVRILRREYAELQKRELD
jgi:hypothetical protein